VGDRGGVGSLIDSVYFQRRDDTTAAYESGVTAAAGPVRYLDRNAHSTGVTTP